MNNKELLKEIVETLKISDEEVVEILKLGEVTDEIAIDGVFVKCNNETFEGFLNGFIIYKRGPKEEKPGAKKKAPLPIKVRKSVNNVVFKKLKIAFALTNEDLVEIYEKANVRMTKNDLTTYFRKEGHRHYRALDDRYLRVFLEGVSEL